MQVDFRLFNNDEPIVIAGSDRCDHYDLFDSSAEIREL